VLDYLINRLPKANDKQNDLLAALKVAQQSFTAFGNVSERHLVILDTGINTSGDLDFNKLSTNPNGTVSLMEFTEGGIAGIFTEHIENLKNEPNRLPNLTGVKVSFGLLPATEEQMLSSTGGISENIPRRENFWKAVLTACGVEEEDLFIKSLETPALSADGSSKYNVYSEDEDGFPYVSQVFWDDAVVEPKGLGSDSPPPPPPINPPPVSNLHFKPDSGEYINDAEAKVALLNYLNGHEIVAYLEENPQEKVYIVGTQAKITLGGVYGNNSISSKRVETVKNSLIELIDLDGIVDRIVIISLGDMPVESSDSISWEKFNPPKDIHNEFPDGVNFDTVIAQNNRQVWILFSNSTKYSVLMNYGFIVA
jgi:hypothetical protein